MEPLPFTFLDGNEDLGGNSFIAVIPSSVSSKSELLNTFASVLRFPDYFGHNWDALEECLRDFHWLNAYRIVIVHEAFPLSLRNSDLRIYLSILESCIKSWKPGEEHELIAAFPAQSRKTIADILR